jgi:hypothetical protein
MNEHFLLDTNVVVDAVRYVVDPAVSKLRWKVSHDFLKKHCRDVNCFISDLTQYIELPRVLMKMFLSNNVRIEQPGSLLSIVRDWVNEWLSKLKINVISIDVSDYEVALALVRACQGSDSTSPTGILEGAVNVILLATALSKGYSFVTTDENLVCGLSGAVISNFTITYTIEGLCMAEARLNVNNRRLNISVYLISDKCRPGFKCWHGWCRTP